MSQAKIGIIGGSGLYHMASLENPVGGESIPVNPIQGHTIINPQYPLTAGVRE